MGDALSQRIAILRFIMIAGVVVLHTPLYVPLADTGSDLFSLVKAFFQHAVFRTTVPVLTFISGYLLFSSGLDRRPLDLIRKKSRSILLPFLFFNLVVLAGAWLGQSMLGLSLSYDLVPFDAEVWMNAAFGLAGSPINYPLNFLRDLLALLLLAPLFGMMLRRAPWIGLIAVTVVFNNNLDSQLILRNLMPIIFFVGGMAAIGKWNMAALDRFALPLLALFLGLCAAIVYFEIENTHYLGLVAPLMLWPAVSLLVGTGFGRWAARMSRYSFFIFLAHAPLLLASWMVYQRLGGALPYQVYWFLAPMLTVATLMLIYNIAMAVCTTPFLAVVGASRGGKQRRAASPKEAAAAYQYFRYRVAQGRYFWLRSGQGKMPG
jgi:succinoglycan biosynthesis protein ExoH